MPRRWITLLAGLGLMAGTADLRGQNTPPSSEPLAVHLVSTFGFRTESVRLNGPAHVAIFRIDPGRSIRLLYPWNEAVETPLDGGTTAVALPLFHAFRGQTVIPVAIGRAFSDLSVIYVVASTEPLQLARLPEEVLRPFGPPVVAPWLVARGSPFGVMDRLLDALVPVAAPGTWAADYRVLWRIPARRVSPYMILADRTRDRPERPVVVASATPARPEPDDRGKKTEKPEVAPREPVPAALEGQEDRASARAPEARPPAEPCRPEPREPEPLVPEPTPRDVSRGHRVDPGPSGGDSPSSSTSGASIARPR
ncbi:MAG: hypothetical protein ACREK5_10050 [Gemmatimonadota bacterium]